MSVSYLTKELPESGWMRRAACQHSDPALFFLENADQSAGCPEGNYDEAKAICAACPVDAECLNWALATGERNGIWGGMTPQERRRAGRRRRVA